MSDVVTAALKDAGAAGAAISVLMGTVTALVGAVVVLYKKINTVNEEAKKTSEETTKLRLAERDVFAKLIGDTNTALTGIADATKQRNRVTEELADAIKAQATVFAIVNERVNLYHGDNKDKLKDVADVVGSIAQAMRTNTSNIVEVRNEVRAGNEAVLREVQRRRS